MTAPRLNGAFPDLKKGIEAAIASGCLNKWEMKFLSYVEEQLMRYGDRSRLSSKQIAKVREIVDRHVPAEKVIAFPSPSQGRSRPATFGARELPRSRQRQRRGRWLVFLALAPAVILAVAAWYYASSRQAAVASAIPSSAVESIAGNRLTVTDGDTIHISGQSKATRLVGFNAPETINARCDRERELGNRATARLKQLVGTSNLQLRMVACSCPPGTEGTESCNYGRSCGSLLVDGRDVGEILMEEGLAVPFICGTYRCPKTQRPWCG